MKVVVSRELMEQMARHGEETYPHECCGFLLGQAEEEAHTVIEARRQSNERTDSKENRFLITPAEFKAAERYARAAGIALLGIYHSHPDSPARPSEYDRDHAWPWFSYIIVSVEHGKAVDTKGWQLKDDRSAYDAVGVEVKG
jgi:proteasome lid subunit RPN8/RPN11